MLTGLQDKVSVLISRRSSYKSHNYPAHRRRSYESQPLHPFLDIHIGLFCFFPHCVRYGGA